MFLYLKCSELEVAKFTRDIYIYSVCLRNLKITSHNRFIIWIRYDKDNLFIGIVLQYVSFTNDNKIPISIKPETTNNMTTCINHKSHSTKII